MERYKNMQTDLKKNFSQTVSCRVVESGTVQDDLRHNYLTVLLYLSVIAERDGVKRSTTQLLSVAWEAALALTAPLSDQEAMLSKEQAERQLVQLALCKSSMQSALLSKMVGAEELPLCYA